MSALEINLLEFLGSNLFPAAVTVYLLYERTKTFSEQKQELKAVTEKYDDMIKLVLEVVRGNTAAQTELRATIQKLCEIVNGGK